LPKQLDKQAVTRAVYMSANTLKDIIIL